MEGEARIEAAYFAEVMPRELRADLLVLLLDDKPVLVIIVEVQLAFKRSKLFAWPCYVVGARARYRCPACLLVVTPEAALARRLSQPISLGPGGFVMPMLVLGPSGVPVVTDVPMAKDKPELAVLSAMAHGKTDVALDVAMAALSSTAGLDEERTKLYTDLVLLSVSEAARRELEERMALKNYQYQTDVARIYYPLVRERGLKDGREQGLKEGLGQGLEQGLKEGLEQGLEPLVHQFERRLARTLTPEERSTLATRLRSEGAKTVGDVVLDLSPEDLAAWLAGTTRKAAEPRPRKRRGSRTPA